MAKATKAATKAATKTATKVISIPVKALTKPPVKAAKPVAPKAAPTKAATKPAPAKAAPAAPIPNAVNRQTAQSLANIERISVPSADGGFMVIEIGVGSKTGYRKEYLTDIDPIDHDGEGQE